MWDELKMPVKVNELLAMVQADGWKLIRRKGSHRQFHHPFKSGTAAVTG